MSQDSRGGTSILGSRGTIPGPTPVNVPTRKNHVAELLSRLTSSTASSRAKADAKRSPAINSGHFYGGPTANNFTRTSRPFIGRPTPVSASMGGPTSLAQMFGGAGTAAATASTTNVTATGSNSSGKPTAVTTGNNGQRTSVSSPLQRNSLKHQVRSQSSPRPDSKANTGGNAAVAPKKLNKESTPEERPIQTVTPKRPEGAKQESGRSSPYKRRVAAGRTSALGRTSAMGRTSALRGQNARGGGFSRIQELKLKVVELERVMSQTTADRELMSAQAARIRELEDQLRISPDNMSLASESTVAPSMRRISQLSMVEKWEQQEQQIKKREERVRIREERVARAEAQAKLSQADAKAAVAEKEALQKKVASLEHQRKVDREMLEDLHEQLDLTKNSRDSLQRQVTAYHVSQRTLEKQVAMAQRDSRRTKRLVASLEANVSDLKITVEEKNMENDELNRSITRVMQQANSVLRPTSSEFETPS